MSKKKTINIEFLPEKKVVSLNAPVSLIEAAGKAGIFMDLPCGGKRKCGKCKIILKKGKIPFSLSEKKLLTKAEMKNSVRLACSLILTEDASVYISDKIRNNFKRTVFLKKNTGKLFKFNPLVKIPFSASENRQPIYGAGFDLGTTTIACSLVNLYSGKTVSSLQQENLLTSFGSDVITRLELIKNEKKNTVKFHKILIKQINDLIAVLGSEKSRIACISFTGNTFMQYILFGEYPEGLLNIPFFSPFRAVRRVKASSLGISADCPVIALPGIDSFIGSDAVGGVLVSGIDCLKSGNLIIDLGTNGELVLSNNTHMAASSCACGPAFEGSQISCGMKAVKGAIDSFKWDKKGHLEFSVIGKEKPSGICGTGLIDIMAYLKETKKIDNTGRLAKDKKIKITDKIIINQQDIRHFQLAKAAVRAGISSLAAMQNIKLSNLNNVFISGNFGNFANPENMIKSTLLPEEFKNKIKYIGNASLTAAETVLCSLEALEKTKHIAGLIKFLDLQQCKEFKESFVEYINF